MYKNVRHASFHVYMKNLESIGITYLSTPSPLPDCNKRPSKIIPTMDNEFDCKWSDCGTNFNWIQEYHEHVVEHCHEEFEKAKKNVQCQWHECSKTNEKLSLMIIHIKNHTDEKFAACTTCKATFKSHSSLYDHFKRQDTNRK